MVRGSDHYHRVGILCVQQGGGVGHGRCRVAPVGLQYYVLFGQFGEMLLHHAFVLEEGCHVDVLDGNRAGHPFEGIAYETLLLIPHPEELFRFIFAAQGPESGPDAAGEDNAISVVSHKLV